jgi:hypothetical protein
MRGKRKGFISRGKLHRSDKAVDQLLKRPPRKTTPQLAQTWRQVVDASHAEPKRS